MGHTVNFRSYKPSYKDKKSIKRSPEEWQIIENTHEAIVDAETWKLAQRVRQTVRRTDTTGEANPLTGLLFCADCGAKMYNHKRGGRALRDGMKIDPESGLYSGDNYNCSTYSLSAKQETRKCFGHYITTKAVRALILDTIRTVSTGHFHSLINDHGRIERIHYKPGNELELDCVLQKERIASAVRKRTPRKKKPAVR